MIKNNKTLLSVLAHPDDESFGMGGTLALYARQGVEVHLVCATRGEVGTVDPKHLRGFASIAARREAELRCAAEKLGLAGVHFMDYRDSGMPGSPDNKHARALAAAPVEEVAEKIVHYIRELRPQVVVTFDPIGGYKHPDHIAIHKATVQAFHMAGDPAMNGDLPPFQPQRLYFHVIPKKFMRLAVWLLSLMGKDPRRYGRNRDINLTALVQDGDFPTHAKINYHEVVAIKDDATKCHASQLYGPGLRRGPLRWAMTLLGDNDYFMRAYPPVDRRLRERDLFQQN